MQDIEKKLEKNAEERAEIFRRISTNKSATDQKNADIESEIAEVRKAHEELKSIQESFSSQVFKIWPNCDDFPDGRLMIKTKSTWDTRREWRVQ